MFLINTSENEALSMEKKTFSALSFKERENLQEWIDKNPAILGENLLIIQKEFDGFSDTQERLDLLALDEEQRLVIIENKLDSSGKDVVWQALKYASYCATLKTTEICDIYQKYLDRYKGGGDAKQNIADFYGKADLEGLVLNGDNSNQRVILVAANFRKEVTSTVLWLQNYGLDIKCLRVTPYQHEDSIFLDTEQLLPPPDTDDYRIRLANKSQEARQTQEEISNREKICLEFWQYALPKLRETSPLYNRLSPSKDPSVYISFGAGKIYFSVITTRTTARVELYIGTDSEEENKQLFDSLHQSKEQYQKAFGETLHWDRMTGKKNSRIYVTLHNVTPFEGTNDWASIVKFFGDKMPKLESAFKSSILKMVAQSKEL